MKWEQESRCLEGKRSDYGGFMEQGIFPLVWQMSNGPHPERRHKIDNWHSLTLSPSLAGDVSENCSRDGSWKGSTVPPWSRSTESPRRHSELPIESLAAPLFYPMSLLWSLSQITAKLSFSSLFSAKINPACSYTAGYKKEEILDLMKQLGGTFMGILCH